MYCAVDDFCKRVDEAQGGHLLPSGTAQRQRAGQLSDSEALTIMIHFHQSHYRTFKAYYDQLKNLSQIEHSRHRSPIHFLVNLVSGLFAYTHQAKKSSLDLAQFRRLEEAVYP
ncbi:MAG: hypothetical protein IT321_02935 [Anaerolineae bacterium]|nr:hypothetical protein [Anaerolineae bacterium]